MLICGVKSYRFESYYLPKIFPKYVYKPKRRSLFKLTSEPFFNLLPPNEWSIGKRYRNGMQFLRRHYIRRRAFKKKKYMYRCIFIQNLIFIKNLTIKKRSNIYERFKKTFLFEKSYENDIINLKKNIFLSLSQKNKNIKSTILFEQIIKTSSIGSVLRYLNVQKKSVRRSLLGLRIFINFLKKMFLALFFERKSRINNVIFNLSGFNNMLYVVKKKIFSNFFKKVESKSLLFYILVSLKIDFCKKKNKKIKSIKKRLRKKILINFKKMIKRNQKL